MQEVANKQCSSNKNNRKPETVNRKLHLSVYRKGIVPLHRKFTKSFLSFSTKIFR
jgi:hypothetical protein